MKKNYFAFLVVLVLMLWVVASCSSSKKTESNLHENLTGVYDNTPVESIVTDTFVLPTIPITVTDSDKRAVFLVMNYWERFDFTNRNLIDRPEITEQAFVDYINLLGYVSKDVADASLRKTIKKAHVDVMMYSHFGNLFEKYFYDPNSPFRNEEYYIPVLEEITVSDVLSEAEKSVYKFHYEMVMKNRVGEKGNNFNYTLASGKTHSLYNLKSEYTLLMFSNPGCSTCAAVTNQILNSNEITNAIALNSSTRSMLTILTLYIDEDIDMWLANLPNMPTKWIHSYDKDMEITHKKLYDVKAIPTLYLFDKEKNVILKDTSIEAIEMFFARPN